MCKENSYFMTNEINALENNYSLQTPADLKLDINQAIRLLEHCYKPHLFMYILKCTHIVATPSIPTDQCILEINTVYNFLWELYAPLFARGERLSAAHHTKSGRLQYATISFSFSIVGSTRLLMSKQDFRHRRSKHD